MNGERGGLFETKKIKMLTQGVRYMLLGTFGFSIMQLSIKYLKHLPTTELIFFRTAIAAVWCVLYLRHIDVPLRGNNPRLLLLRSLLGLTGMSFLYISIKNMPLATAVTLNYLSPVFTAILGIFILKEKVKPIQWLFFGMAFTGVLLIKGFDERIELVYLAIGVLSAMFAAGAYISVRELRKYDHPFVVILYFSTFAAIITGILMLFNWQMPSLNDVFFIITMALGAQMGQIFLTRGFQAEVAQRVSSVKYIGVLYALGYGFFFFGELYSWLSLLGIALIILGVVLNVAFKGSK